MCEECIIKCWSSSESRKKKCPIGRCELPKQKITLDITLNEIMEDIEIYCTLKRDGCKWKGPRNMLNSHLRTCDVKNIPSWVKKYKKKSGVMDEEKIVNFDIDEDEVVEKVNKIDETDLITALYLKDKELATRNLNN